MRLYLANLIIALGATAYLRKVWPILAETGLRTLGAFLGVCVLLWLLSFLYNRRFFRQLPRIMHLTVYFIKELIVANIKVTYEVLTIKNTMSPAVVAVPLEVQRNEEIMLLANMITLTPGTLSLQVSDDRKRLYVHTLYIGSHAEEFRQQIKAGFEKKILAITRIPL